MLTLMMGGLKPHMVNNSQQAFSRILLKLALKVCVITWVHMYMFT